MKSEYNKQTTGPPPCEQGFKSTYTSMGMPMWPRWINDHDAAHVQAKTVLMDMIWN